MWFLSRCLRRLLYSSKRVITWNRNIKSYPSNREETLSNISILKVRFSERRSLFVEKREKISYSPICNEKTLLAFENFRSFYIGFSPDTFIYVERKCISVHNTEQAFFCMNFHTNSKRKIIKLSFSLQI